MKRVNRQINGGDGTEMGICLECNGVMLKVDGCTKGTIAVNGGIYKRIKCGAPGDNADITTHDLPFNWRCPDCGARPGYYHHFGCDQERCPVCGGQLIGCECNAHR